MNDDFVLSSRQYKSLLQELKDAENYGKSADDETVKARGERDKALADVYELTRRLANAERVLEGCGYRRCDIPACNCNSYHCLPPKDA